MGEVDSFRNIMFDQLLNFMREGMFTDVVFVVGDSKFPAHKAVLASSSPVFSSMFSSPMKEASSNEVFIADVDERAFSAFLNYIYSTDAKVLDLDEESHVEQLLMLADKYDIEPLSKLCDDAVVRMLGVHNAVDFLILADLHRRSCLEFKVSQFIEKHRRDIDDCGGWVKLKNSFDLIERMLGIFTVNERQINNDATESPTPSEFTWTQLICKQSKFKHTVMPSVILSTPNAGSPEYQVSLINVNGKLELEVKVLRNENHIPEIETTKVKITATLSRDPKYLRRIAYALGKRNVTVYINRYVTNVTITLDEMFDRTVDNTFDLTVSLSQIVDLNNPSRTKMFKDEFADAKLTIGDLKLPIYTSEVAEKSEFFADLFEPDIVEFEPDIVEYEISGMSKITLAVLVKFMSSDVMPEPHFVNLRLLRGAHKFKLVGLIDYCASILETKITIANAAEMYATADELCLEELEGAVKTFVVKHACQIVKSGKLSEFKNKNEVLRELFLKGGLRK